MLEENTTQKMSEIARSFFRRKWVVVVVLFLVFVGLFAFALIRLRPVAYVSRAEKKVARDIVLGTVEVKAFHLCEIRAERGGMIEMASIEVGDNVLRGEEIIDIDSEALELKIENVQIQKKFTEDSQKLTRGIDFSLDEALEDLEIKNRLYDKGQLTQKELDDSSRYLEELKDLKKRTKLREKLDIQIADNNLEHLRYGLNRKTVKSPVAGTVTNVYVRKGDVVRQGDVLAEIIDNRRLIVAEIGEEDFYKLKTKLPLELRLKSYPNQVFEGIVSQILPTSDPVRKKIEIYISSAELSDDKTIPGLTGEVTIIVDARENACVVPSQAVYAGYVLKVEGNRIEKVKVETGFVNMLDVEILKGVEPGDIVVTESNNLFDDGLMVRTEWE